MSNKFTPSPRNSQPICWNEINYTLVWWPRRHTTNKLNYICFCVSSYYIFTLELPASVTGGFFRRQRRRPVRNHSQFLFQPCATTFRNSGPTAASVVRSWRLSLMPQGHQNLIIFDPNWGTITFLKRPWLLQLNPSCGRTCNFGRICFWTQWNRRGQRWVRFSTLFTRQCTKARNHLSCRRGAQAKVLAWKYPMIVFSLLSLAHLTLSIPQKLKVFLKNSTKKRFTLSDVKKWT